MFEISSVLAQPVGLITDAIFLAWLCLLSKLALQYQIPILYQLIWRICVCAIVATFILLPGTTLKIFIVQFSFRYVRLLVNLTAFCLYKPIVISGHPDLTARNVTVIIPTVEPYGKLFEECIESIYASGPAKIIIVTAGAHNYDRAIESASMYPDIRIMRCHIQNKRKQLQIAIREVRKEGEFVEPVTNGHRMKGFKCGLPPFSSPEPPQLLLPAHFSLTVNGHSR